jgi:hypothetical protein
MAPRTQRTTDHAAGTEDEPFAAEPPPDDRARSSWWLPRGHHYDLHVEHRSLEHAGPFTGGGNKLVWHITASGWMTADARALTGYGAMLWLRWKTLPGSYRRLTSRSRW